jgi:hypothetical protein
MNKFQALEDFFTSGSTEEDLSKEFKEYQEWIEESKKRMDPYFSEKNLSQKSISILFTILNEAYGYINYINQSYDYEENIQEIIKKMVNQLDYFYLKMDKYHSFICSEDGFNAIKEYGDLEDIDFYYNMTIVNKCIDYIFIALECSPEILLNQIDIIYSEEPNRKKRYQTYFHLLQFIFKKKPILYDTKNKNNLYRICQGDEKLMKEFKELSKKIIG